MIYIEESPILKEGFHKKWFTCKYSCYGYNTRQKSSPSFNFDYITGRGFFNEFICVVYQKTKVLLINPARHMMQEDTENQIESYPLINSCFFDCAISSFQKKT